MGQCSLPADCQDQSVLPECRASSSTASSKLSFYSLLWGLEGLLRSDWPPRSFSRGHNTQGSYRDDHHNAVDNAAFRSRLTDRKYELQREKRTSEELTEGLKVGPGPRGTVGKNIHCERDWAVWI